MQPKPLRHLFDAMHHGKYDFNDFLHLDTTQSYTVLQLKHRTLYSPHRKLKAYLVFLNAFLFEYLDINHRVVYSYRKGVNPHETALPHAQSRAFLQTDLNNFFGSISRDIIASTVLSQHANIPISDLNSYIDRILDMTTIDNVLPLGFPTSPIISNVCLTKFDNELEGYCTDSDLVYTRYADDIVISGKSRDALLEAEEKIQTLLSQHYSGKLTVNRTKRKLTTIGRKIRIMGMVILPNGQITIDMELKKHIEVLLHYYIRDRNKFSDKCNGDIDTGLRKLSGYINYINSADKPYLNKLRRKFGATVLDSFLHRSAQ